MSYTDNGDGTFTDNNTKFMWEEKDLSGTVHNVNNTYTWSSSGTNPDGTLFTLFLHTLNNTCAGDQTTPCTSDANCTGIGSGPLQGKCGFAGYMDWRIPNVKELQSLFAYNKSIPAASFPGLSCPSISTPCYVFSATTFVADQRKDWVVGFPYGDLNANENDYKTQAHGARAMRISPPTANAGSDQTVNEGSLVTLDGSGSTSSDGGTLTYHWTQIAGPAVTLNLTDPVHPTFTAPNVSVSQGSITLTFQLIVTEGDMASDPVFVNITDKHVNQPPVADAGPNQTVQEGSPVTLDGSNSYDPDSDPITYSWTQTAGPTVTFNLTDPVHPTFTAPSVSVSQVSITLTFKLTVSDGIASSSPSVSIIVQHVNHAPTAVAGNQTVNEGNPVTLDGTASSDPDSDPLTFKWTQLSGPAVTLSDPHSSTPTFTAPQVNRGGATLVFQLVVNDGLLDSAPSDVTITVQDVDDPPLCNLAQPSLGILWPPNHKLVPVGIQGVTDPNNDTVTVTITSVTQDEPVNGLGDGDTSPDAVIQGDQVLLREERSGTGNGRVYQINFTADDDYGGSCTGSVAVCVPHDREKNTCVNDGQRYSSLTK